MSFNFGGSTPAFGSTPQKRKYPLNLVTYLYFLLYYKCELKKNTSSNNNMFLLHMKQIILESQLQSFRAHF